MFKLKNERNSWCAFKHPYLIYTVVLLIVRRKLLLLAGWIRISREVVLDWFQTKRYFESQLSLRTGLQFSNWLMCKKFAVVYQNSHRDKRGFQIQLVSMSSDYHCWIVVSNFAKSGESRVCAEQSQNFTCLSAVCVVITFPSGRDQKLNCDIENNCGFSLITHGI